MYKKELIKILNRLNSMIVFLNGLNAIKMNMSDLLKVSEEESLSMAVKLHFSTKNFSDRYIEEMKKIWDIMEKYKLDPIHDILSDYAQVILKDRNHPSYLIDIEKSLGEYNNNRLKLVYAKRRAVNFIYDCSLIINLLENYIYEV